MSSVYKQNLSINRAGAISDYELIKPGTTELNNGGVLDEHVRIHIHDIDLHTSGAANVTLKIGSKTIFTKSFTGVGDYNKYNVDLYNNQEDGAGEDGKLTMDISSSATITGNIMWSFKFAGGDVIKTAQDTYGV